ncbi:unnamed protein product, partial [Ectocarpus fasciculatus]
TARRSALPVRRGVDAAFRGERLTLPANAAAATVVAVDRHLPPPFPALPTAAAAAAAAADGVGTLRPSPVPRASAAAPVLSRAAVLPVLLGARSAADSVSGVRTAR